jgi:hypothetical protein
MKKNLGKFPASWVFKWLFNAVVLEKVLPHLGHVGTGFESDILPKQKAFIL